MKASNKELEDFLREITEEEIQFWREYAVTGLGQFYREFRSDCPTTLASAYGF